MKKDKNKPKFKFSFSYNWIYVIAIAQIIVLSFIRLQLSDTTFVNNSLALLHQSNLIAESGSLYDPFIMGGRTFMFSFLPYIFFIIAKVIGKEMGFIILQLSLITGLIKCVEVFGNLLQLSKQRLFYILAMLVLSPTLLGLTVAHPQLVFVVILQSLGLIALVKNYKLGYLMLGLAAIEGWIPAVITSLLLILFYKNKAIDQKKCIAGLFIQSIIFIVFLLPQLITHPRTSPLIIIQQGLANTFVELGAINGLSIIMCSLSALGAIILYKRRYFIEAVTVIGIVGLSLWFVEFRVLTAIVLAVLTGLFIEFLITYKWDLDILQTVSLGTIVVGIFGALFVMGGQVALEGPTSYEVTMAEWAHQNLPENVVILSSPKQSLTISSLAQKKIYVDTNLVITPNASLRLNYTDQILNEVYLPKTKGWLDNQSITHIVITPEFVENRDESDPSGGLIYLLQNNETFKNVYRDNGYRVIEYLKNK